MKLTGAVAVVATGVLALAACGGGGESDADGETIYVNAFSVMEAANEPVFEDFQATDA
jgi:ABC-type glycerol-3-phosphate transport system substrate-binding protein